MYIKHEELEAGKFYWAYRKGYESFQVVKTVPSNTGKLLLVQVVGDSRRFSTDEFTFIDLIK